MTLLPPLRGAQHLAPCQAPREETESPDKASELEPVSGFEPLTCRLQEACSRALGPLPAPMPHENAPAAPKTLGFPAPPFHDPFHAPSSGYGMRLCSKHGREHDGHAVLG